MKHQLGCEVDEVTGQILLAGIHDASVRGICHDRNGKVVLSLSGSSLEQCQLVVSGTKNAFVFSAGLALPLIVEAAFLAPMTRRLPMSWEVPLMALLCGRANG